MASTNIPLHCSICPKRPNFSDVSHLLTHIASKGHLSHYYKLKVRSGTDDAARRLVESYDRWYSEWAVEDLMSERMTQKDKRRSRAARPLARQTSAPKIEAPVPRSARPRAAAVGNLLDPRLTEQQLIKLESVITPTSTPQSGPVLRQRPPRTFGVHMHYWPGAESRASSRSFTNDYESSSEYDPGERQIGRYRRNTVEEDSCAIEDDPYEVDSMAVSESTKLKGVYWPGMDIFDSATPEMRRKRNQKKDSSVVEQLELNSQEVEPTELIFTPTGSFKRQRRISSSVYDDDEDDIIKAESPILPLPRLALGDMDVNVPRRQRYMSRAQPFYIPRSGCDDEYARSDLEITFGDRAPKPKRRFEVFQDDEAPFGHPTPFTTLTAGFRVPTSPTLAPNLPPYKGFGHTSFPFDDPENKENIAPAYHHSTAYEHSHMNQPATFAYQASSYTYGLTQDHVALQDPNPLYFPPHGYHPSQDEDDSRTLTAPPSPSTT